MHAFESKTDEAVLVMKSDDTTLSLVYSIIPFIFPSAASLTALLISSNDAGFSRRAVKSTTETSAVGTLKIRQKLIFKNRMNKKEHTGMPCQ